MWGHYTTKDFIRYRREPIAIFPDDRRDRDGVYSGSALVKGGKLSLYYTGNVRHQGDFDYIHAGREQNVLRVESEDGIHFSRKTLLMTNADFPADMTNHVRDPQIVAQNGRLWQKPLAELEALRGPRTRQDGRAPARFHSRRCELRVRPEPGQDVTIRLYEDAALRFSADEKLLTLEMGPVCGAGRDLRRMKLERLEELDLYLDGSTLEVFVNGGCATMTSRIFGADDTLALDAFAGVAEYCPMRAFEIADARENGV